MGHTNIEEEIVQGGVHQCKGKNKLPVVALAHLKRTSTATGHRKDYQPCHRKPDASKKHLGVRGLKSTIFKILDDEMFSLDTEEIVIDRQFVEKKIA